MKCWVLIYVLSGRLDISSGGICRSVASGEWLFLKPGEEHFGTAPSEGELSYLWAHFSPETPFFEGESGAAYTLPEYGRAASQRIGVIFRQLVDCSRRNMYTTRMVECALEMLLTELTQERLDSCGHCPLHRRTLLCSRCVWYGSLSVNLPLAAGYQPI